MCAVSTGPFIASNSSELAPNDQKNSLLSLPHHGQHSFVHAGTVSSMRVYVHLLRNQLRRIGNFAADSYAFLFPSIQLINHIQKLFPKWRHYPGKLTMVTAL